MTADISSTVFYSFYSTINMLTSQAAKEIFVHITKIVATIIVRYKFRCKFNWSECIICIFWVELFNVIFQSVSVSFLNRHMNARTVLALISNDWAISTTLSPLSYIVTITFFISVFIFWRDILTGQRWFTECAAYVCSHAALSCPRAAFICR